MSPSPQEIIDALDAKAQLVRTPVAKGSIAWRIWGEGEPLVLFHGGHGSWKHWIRNIPELASRYRVIAVDLPGMGDSSPVDGDLMEDVSLALAEGLDQLGIDRYVLGAFSYGSLVAGHMLNQHAHRIKHLIIIGAASFGKVDMVTSQLRRWQDKTDPEVRQMIHRHNLAVLMLHDPAKIDELAVAVQSDNTERTVVNHRSAALSADLRACILGHDVPVTAIWGEEDALVRNHFDERREAVKQFAPGSQMILIPDAGHWVQYEAPTAFNAKFMAVIDQVLP